MIPEFEELVKLSQSELVKCVESHADGMSHIGCIGTDYVADARERAKKDADQFIADFPAKKHYWKLRYALHLAYSMKQAREQYLANLLSSDDWYTKVKVILGKNNQLVIDDFAVKELSVLIKACEYIFNHGYRIRPCMVGWNDSTND